MDGKTKGPVKSGMPLHTKIFIGLAIGLASGLLSNALFHESERLGWVVDHVAQPVGQIFLRMLFMVVVPLVFTSITLGVAGLSDLERIGRIGGKALALFLGTTAIAVVIGLTIVNVLRPGDTLDPGVRQALLLEYAPAAATRVGSAPGQGFGVDTLVAIVPRNPVDSAARGDMLGLIFFSLVFGVALARLPAKTSRPVLDVIEGLGQAVSLMIGFAMKLAPIGVGALIFSVTARFGLDILSSLALYMIAVLGALLIHQFGAIALLVHFFGGMSPWRFFRRIRAVMLTAFSTSSSNATLPTTIRTAQEELGVPREIAGFVLPLGATMNMNGTALFEGMTVLFLAQVFGIELSLSTQLVVVVMSVITAIGVAGVPGGSIPLLVMVMEMVGVPGEGIALILGVDRILDMCRTVPNVTGDLLTSVLVTKSERLPLMPTPVPNPEAVAAMESSG